MVSLRGRFINFMVVRTRYKDNMQKALASGFRRRGEPSAKIIARNGVVKSAFAGRDVYTLYPSAAAAAETPARILLYFHGGAYFYDIMVEHFAGLSKLSLAANVPIIAPSYPLAPEASPEDIRDFAVSIYDDMRARYPKAKIIVGGDSAGAGLAVQMTQALQARGDRLPPALILWSPWVDISLSNPDVLEADKRSVIIGYEGIIQAAKIYAGDRPLTDPLCSPIYSDLSGLPPLHIWAGTRDLLYPDIVKFAALARDVGVSVQITEARGQNHMYMFMPQPDVKAVMRATARAINGA